MFSYESCGANPSHCINLNVKHPVGLLPASAHVAVERLIAVCKDDVSLIHVSIKTADSEDVAIVSSAVSALLHKMEKRAARLDAFGLSDIDEYCASFPKYLPMLPTLLIIEFVSCLSVPSSVVEQLRMLGEYAPRCGCFALLVCEDAPAGL